MSQKPKLLSFKLDDLHIAVNESDAYLALDRGSSAVVFAKRDAGGSCAAVYRGRVMPILDLRRCLGLPAAEGGAGPFTLVLEHKGELACLRTQRITVARPGAARESRPISDRFQGLARLLISEELSSADGVFQKLDVEMLVRIANQSATRPSRQTELAGATSAASNQAQL